MRLMINGAVIPFFLTLFSAIISQVLEIKSGKSFCFYDDLKLNNNWGVHFQSSEGAFGIDVNFHFHSNLFLHFIPFIPLSFIYL